MATAASRPPALHRAGAGPAARQLLLGVLFLAVLALLFWPTLVWMADVFNKADSFYSHGWLIPLASGWLVWQRREMLEHLTVRPSYAGLVLLVPSVLVHVLAHGWGVHLPSALAMVTALWGLIWTLWGRDAVWALRFPLFFLLFMVPLPGILLLAISFKMKLLAAALATHALHLMGLSAVQAGSTIHLPGVSVVVDDACSGLRSLISLIALATLWTALLPSSATRSQKLLMVAASMPIALAANMVRIVILSLVAVIYGPHAAEGFIHYGSGFVVFGVALAALAWLSRAMTRGSSAAGGAS